MSDDGLVYGIRNGYWKPGETQNGNTIKVTIDPTTYKIVPTVVIEAECKVKEPLPALPEGGDGDK